MLTIPKPALEAVPTFCADRQPSGVRDRECRPLPEECRIPTPSRRGRSRDDRRLRAYPRPVARCRLWSSPAPYTHDCHRLESRAHRLPAPNHVRTPDLTDAPPWRSVRDAIGALPERPVTTELPTANTEFFGRAVPGQFKWLDLHFGRNPRELSLRRYRHTTGRGLFLIFPMICCLVAGVRSRPAPPTSWGRMRWDYPSLTIRTEFFKPEKGQYWTAMGSGSALGASTASLHISKCALARVPGDLRFGGPKIQIAKQIGNAVPVGLAAAIAQQAKGHCNLTLGSR